MATIRINRDSGYADRLRAYQVVVDGKTIGKIKNRETKEFETMRGDHELFLKIDWCRSDKIEFSVADKEKKEFDCGSSLRGLRLFLMIIYGTFLCNRYIWLRESSELPHD